MTPKDIWKQACERIAEQISRPSYETWFKATEAETLEGNTLVVVAPNDFAADWLANRYGSISTTWVREVTGNDELEVKFVSPGADEFPLEPPAPRDSIYQAVKRVESRMDALERKIDHLLQILDQKKR